VYTTPSALVCWTAVSGPPQYGSFVSFIPRFGAVMTLRMKQMKTRRKKGELAKKLGNQNLQQMKKIINVERRVMDKKLGNRNQRGKKSMKWMIQMKMTIR